MTVIEVTQLVAATARAAMLPAAGPGSPLFELVVDENLTWKPRAGVVRMWVEPQGARLAELSGRQSVETCRVTFVAYSAENLGQGAATSQTSKLADAVNGPFRHGCVLRQDSASTDYLNGVAPSRTWIPGKDAHAYPGLFAAAAVVNLDHYARAAAA